eukprot:3699128-Amphidinium_carterae.2
MRSRPIFQPQFLSAQAMARASNTGYMIDGFVAALEPSSFLEAVASVRDRCVSTVQGKLQKHHRAPWNYLLIRCMLNTRSGIETTLHPLANQKETPYLSGWLLVECQGVQKLCQCGNLLLQRTGIVLQPEPQTVKRGASHEPQRLRS